MKRYEPHPFAQIIPPMRPDEYRDLKADIKTNGLEQPITLYEGKILDGIHRERACAELGITVETRDWRKRDGQTPVQYVLSMNGHRRHLSPGQKAALVVELIEQLRKMYPAAMPKGGERPGAADLDAVASALGIKRDDHRDDTVFDIVAATVGVSPTTANEVQTLKTQAPTLYAKVRDGLMDVAEATRERRAAQPKPRKSADEINDALIHQAISQAKALADTVAKLDARKVELAGPNLLFIWGYAFTIAATIKNSVWSSHTAYGGGPSITWGCSSHGINCSAWRGTPPWCSSGLGGRARPRQSWQPLVALAHQRPCGRRWAGSSS